MSEFNPPSDPTSSSAAPDSTSDATAASMPGTTSGQPPAPSHGAPPPPPAPPHATPPTAPSAPPANPYGGYTQAPPASAQYGQVQVGSLPYVEHHFGRVTNFGDRILPSIIDSLLILLGFIPMIIGVIVMAASSTTSGYDEYGNYESGGPSGAGLGIGLLLIFGGLALMLGLWIWNRIIRMGRTGQSVGKKMFNQKLINTTTGQPIGPGQAFVRELIAGLANQIFYLSYLWMLWDPNRQTLGDMVAKSTVIHVPKG